MITCVYKTESMLSEIEREVMFYAIRQDKGRDSNGKDRIEPLGVIQKIRRCEFNHV